MELKGKTGRKWGDNPDGRFSPPSGLWTLTYSFASHFSPMVPSEPPNSFVKRRHETGNKDKALLGFVGFGENVGPDFTEVYCFSFSTSVPFFENSFFEI